MMQRETHHPKREVSPAEFSRFLSLLLVVSLIAGMGLSLKSVGVAHAEGPNAILDLQGCNTGYLPANDDGSSVALALPFTMNFVGHDYSQIFVNNNGNVTFDSGMSAYRPFDLLSTTRVIIAPFFDDVDTRGTGSNTTKYGATSYAGRPAFCVMWVNVGYYSYHVDKLNSFQLLLIDRADTGPGNFDIMFNYDKIQWESTDTATYARAGYSNGSTFAYEIPGSAVTGAFLDSSPTGLIHGSRDSLQLGRYIFPVRTGVAPSGGTISGTLYKNSVALANVVANAFVQVCAGSACHTGSTNANGQYSVMGLPDGSYTAEAFPPGGLYLLPKTIGPLTIAGGASLTGRDIVLTDPTTLPAGTTITPSRLDGGTPRVDWLKNLVLAQIGCPGGAASYQITQGTTVIRSGSMAEAPAGTYTATIAAFYPLHGNAHVKVTLVCPSGGGTTIREGDIYIDPSGVVKTTGGGVVPGATVTLFRSDASSGPFTQVPNGSGLMSPANRANPDTTDATGNFAWDVIAGYYKVRAEKAGCVSPFYFSQAYVETVVLQIPPPVTDLVLVLNCSGVPMKLVYLPLVAR
jgi:hypothetical protein